MSLAMELTRGILAEFGADITNTRVWFDTSNVACLQDDKVALYTVLEKACGGPFLTPNEARKEVGKKPITGGEKMREAKAQAMEQKPGQDAEGDQNDENDAQNREKEAVNNQ